MSGVVVERISMPNSEYHAEQEHESSSGVKRFLESPEGYWAERVARIRPGPKVGYAASLGSAVHTILLEADFDRVQYGPEGSSCLTKAFKSFQESLPPDVIGIAHEDRERVRAICDAVEANDEAIGIINNSDRRERSYFWTCPLTGVKVKSRIDAEHNGGVMLSDLKVTLDPSPQKFSRTIDERGYYISAALYGYGHGLRTGLISPSEQSIERMAARICFKFIAVGCEWPHECFVYELAPSAVELGLAELFSALGGIAQMRDLFGKERKWRRPEHGITTMIDLPYWKYKKVEAV